MANLFNIFQDYDLKGSLKFVGLKAYQSKKTGEVSDYVINCNVSVEKTKKADLKKLQNCKPKTLQAIADKSGIPLDTVNLALAEMIASAIKNLSEKKEDRSAQSKGQSDAYLNINKSVRLHKESMAIHIFGMVISKKVLISGTYKSVNSADKTIAKKFITKALNLSAGKFGTFIVNNMVGVVASGHKFLLLN